MHVLMLGWEFPPLISGGLGTACYGITKHLAELGEDVTFVLPRAPDNPPRERYKILSAEQVEDVEEDFNLPERVLLLTVNSTLVPYANEESFPRLVEQIQAQEMISPSRHGMRSIIQLSGHYTTSLFEEVERFAEIGRRLGKQPFDIIHAHDWMTFPAAIIAHKNSQKPFIAHVHATEYDRTGDAPNPRIVEIEQEGLKHANRVLAVSQRTKEILVRRYNVPQNKIDVVYNAISHEKWIHPSEIHKKRADKLVIFVGRITLQKGPEYFLRAAKVVLRTHPNFRFVMCGAGDMLPSMIEDSARLRMCSHFHFTGFLKNRDLDRLYAMADLFVMTSVSEPFGLTPFEAMRYNVPVIVSKQTGAAEILPHAVQVDFWDTERLAKMIIEFCEERDSMQHVLAELSKTLSSMSWRKVAEQLRSIYREVLRT